jgi:DNA-binding transcriptional MerR regulator
MRSFAIGVLSERTGVKVPTIRFYETIGLLPAPERTQTNRRTYDEDTVRRLRFI